MLLFKYFFLRLIMAMTASSTVLFPSIQPKKWQENFLPFQSLQEKFHLQNTVNGDTFQGVSIYLRCKCWPSIYLDAKWSTTSKLIALNLQSIKFYSHLHRIYQGFTQCINWQFLVVNCIDIHDSNLRSAPDTCWYLFSLLLRWEHLRSEHSAILLA